MNGEWQAPTLKDALQVLAPVPITHADALCPGCGRRVAADMLTDCGPARAAGVAGVDVDWACDGCRERWWREGTVDRAAFYGALGAPAALRERLAAQKPAG